MSAPGIRGGSERTRDDRREVALVRALKAVVHVKELAAALGATHATVSQWAVVPREYVEAVARLSAQPLSAFLICGGLDRVPDPSPPVRMRDDHRAPGLIKAIEKAGSISALARAVGVTLETVSRWVAVPTRHADAVAAATGLPIEQLARPTSWPPERDQRLRELWSQRLTTAAIAARLGTTRNAVIGRVHRLKLTARPSPIRAARAPKDRPTRFSPELASVIDRFGGVDAFATRIGANPGVVRRWKSVPTAERIRVADALGVPVREILPSHVPQSIDKQPERAVTVERPVELPPAAACEPSTAKSRPRPTSLFGNESRCTFPLGDPRESGFRYCDAPHANRGPYCDEHHALCRTRRVVRDDVGANRAPSRGVKHGGHYAWQ